MDQKLLQYPVESAHGFENDGHKVNPSQKRNVGSLAGPSGRPTVDQNDKRISLDTSRDKDVVKTPTDSRIIADDARQTATGRCYDAFWLEVLDRFLPRPTVLLDSIFLSLVVSLSSHVLYKALEICTTMVPAKPMATTGLHSKAETSHVDNIPVKNIRRSK